MRHRGLQILLVAVLILLVGTPLVLRPSDAGTATAALSAGVITAIAFLFNATITIMARSWSPSTCSRWQPSQEAAEGLACCSSSSRPCRCSW